MHLLQFVYQPRMNIYLLYKSLHIVTYWIIDKDETHQSHVNKNVLCEIVN